MEERISLVIICSHCEASSEISYDLEEVGEELQTVYCPLCGQENEDVTEDEFNFDDDNLDDLDDDD